tara:strand:+ start:174 stop:362 length:189 start_codon:yes stop_codon:yes gene_type:complete
MLTQDNTAETSDEILIIPAAIEKIEDILNVLWDEHDVTNEGLKKILHQIIIDVDRGFVGEPC